MIALAIAIAMVSVSCSTQVNQPMEDGIAYPQQNITMVIPFGEGGGTDAWGRIIAELMGEELGVQIEVKNITGGTAGSDGIAAVWDAPHDGYTIAATSETPLTIPVLTDGEQTSKDWEYFIAAGSPGILAINKDAYENYPSMQFVVDALADNYESVSIAGTSGGLWFVMAQLFAEYGDVPFEWLSYSGSADAIEAARIGEAQTVVASAGELKAYVDSGELIPIAVMDHLEWEFPGYGDVPPVTGSVPALASYLPLKQYLGFKIPADTDEQVIARLKTAFDQVMKSPEIKKEAEDQLCEVYALSGDEARVMVEYIESNLCWMLDEMGQTLNSPNDYAIPVP